MKTKRLRCRVSMVCGMLAIVGCAGNGTVTTSVGGTVADLKYNGSFVDSITVAHTVSNTVWASVIPGQGTCTRTISAYDNATGSASYQEGSTVCFSANKFGRVYFTTDSASDIYYCDFVSGKTSAADAAAVAGAPTATSPSASGCNGKAWIKLNKPSSNLYLNGNFTDQFAGSYTFTNTLWTDITFGCVKDIIFYDNVNGFFTYQEEGGACFNPYKFGKVYWTVDSAKRLYYCELIFNKTSYFTAANDTTKPGYTAPATTGCGGFSWSQKQ